MYDAIKQKQYREKIRQENKCVSCKKEKELNNKACCSSCITKAIGRAKNKNYWQIRKEHYVSLGLCVRCKKEKVEEGKINCNKCLAKLSIKSQEIKAKVIFHYGNKCVCCGEDNLGFLTIDHINNDGAEQRKSIFGTSKCGRNFYSYIIRENYPSDLQTMCYNCNCGRFHNNNVCPHKKG